MSLAQELSRGGNKVKPGTVYFLTFFGCVNLEILSKNTVPEINTGGVKKYTVPGFSRVRL